MNQQSNWQSKHVVVSGGSSGLGLHLVRAAARQKACVTILGRNEDRLRQAVEIARDAGASFAQSYACDALDASQTSSLPARLSEKPVDLLINAIGRSDRGPLVSLSSDDLRAMFEDNVLATFQITKALIPLLSRGETKTGKGVLVNIGSLAGIVATPNMGGYCVSKFALTAISRQWRHELRELGIHVLLVSPGPIEREDSHTRYRDLVADRGLNESQANKPGGGAKLKLLDPQKLSTEVLAAAWNGQYEWTQPSKVKLLAALGAIWPSLADSILRKNLKSS